MFHGMWSMEFGSLQTKMFELAADTTQILYGRCRAQREMALKDRGAVCNNIIIMRMVMLSLEEAIYL